MLFRHNTGVLPLEKKQANQSPTRSTPILVLFSVFRRMIKAGKGLHHGRTDAGGGDDNPQLPADLLQPTGYD